jgi:acetyltransferase-like isoleucine patch superfamily enzyme
MGEEHSARDSRLHRFGRISWALVSFAVVQTLVCGLAALPIVLLWSELFEITAARPVMRAVALSLAAVPSYVLFTLLLMVVSPLATRLAGWRTPPAAEIRIADVEWPLLTWARYGASSHLVRVLAGTLFRGSPIWTAYLRLNGARMGRRVYVNTLFVADHNLLDFDDDVVIGGEVHISGHTVEAGIVKTGTVRLGPRVTIGLGSVIDIDVEVGAGCQVGAQSLVPKHARLEAGGVYVGIPARRLET